MIAINLITIVDVVFQIIVFALLESEKKWWPKRIFFFFLVCFDF